MLRAAGVLLIIAGIGAGFFAPSLIERNSGGELARVAVFDRKDGGWQQGWRAQKIALSKRHNPMRLVIEAEFLPGLKLLSATTALQVSLAHGGKTVMEGEFDLTVPKLGGSEQPVRRSSLVTPPFSIADDGDYIVFVRSAETTDINYSTVDAVVRSNIEIPDNRIRDTGFGAIGLGLALLLFSSIARRNRSSPNRPAKKASRWGRN
ncbi:MAG: hypothetical protein R3D32_12175 [Nitratireductor sp.]